MASSFRCWRLIGRRRRSRSLRMLRSDDDDRLARSVLGCDPQLVACHVDDNRTGRELQRRPRDCDLSAAHSEKSAEIDDGGPYVAGLVDDDIRDLPEFLAGRALHVSPKKIFDLIVIDDNRRSSLACCRLTLLPSLEGSITPFGAAAFSVAGTALVCAKAGSANTATIAAPMTIMRSVRISSPLSLAGRCPLQCPRSYFVVSPWMLGS